MTSLYWVTVGCYVSCQFDLRATKADTHRLVTRQQPCIKNTDTHSSCLHLHHLQHIHVLYFNYSAEQWSVLALLGLMIELVWWKRDTYPPWPLCPCPCSEVRGLGWFDMRLSKESAPDWFPLVGGHCVGGHCVSAAPLLSTLHSGSNKV